MPKCADCTERLRVPVKRGSTFGGGGSGGGWGYRW